MTDNITITVSVSDTSDFVVGEMYPLELLDELEYVKVTDIAGKRVTLEIPPESKIAAKLMRIHEDEKPVTFSIEGADTNESNE